MHSFIYFSNFKCMLEFMYVCTYVCTYAPNVTMFEYMHVDLCVFMYAYMNECMYICNRYV